jgi:predicted RNase H-like HicB family nuclease
VKHVEKYEIDIFWSDEDAVFVAIVPELEGCAAHGDTPESALSAVTAARDLWLEEARRIGREVPPPRTRRAAKAG